MCIKIDVLFSIIQVVRVQCGKLVSAAGSINNGGMFECLVSGVHYTTIKMERWARYVNLQTSVHTTTVCFKSLQMITNHKRPNVARSICH